MPLRPLEMRDAAPMLAWMHDPGVVEKLRSDFASKTLEDCRAFIRASRTSEKHLHDD